MNDISKPTASAIACLVAGLLLHLVGGDVDLTIEIDKLLGIIGDKEEKLQKTKNCPEFQAEASSFYGDRDSPWGAEESNAGEGADPHVHGCSNRGWEASCAFDGDMNTAWDGCCGDYWKGVEVHETEDGKIHVFIEQVLELRFREPVRLQAYAMATMEEECPISWTFEAAARSEAGLWKWMPLHGVSNATCKDGSFSKFYPVVDSKQEEFDTGMPPAFTRYRWIFEEITPGWHEDRHRNGYRLREIALHCWTDDEGDKAFQFASREEL